MSQRPLRAGRCAASCAGVLLAALALVSCGDQPPAAVTVPGLTDSLTEVDAAVADKRYRAARRALARLTATTLEARRTGELGQDQADRILAAAARLEHELPTPPPAPPPPVQGGGGSDKDKKDEEDEGDGD